MGCKQSKAAVERKGAGSALAEGGELSPKNTALSRDSGSATKAAAVGPLSAVRPPRSVRPDNRVYKLLTGPAATFDPQAVLHAVSPAAAAYRDSDTQSTPLHLCVKLLDAAGGGGDEPSLSLLPVVQELIRAHPDAVQATDAAGHIPLHYAIAPIGGADLPASSWKLRTAVVRHLLLSDPTPTSALYLQRNDVSYCAKSMPGCSPLYRVVQTVPDDAAPLQAPTLEFVHLVLKAMSGGGGGGTPLVCVGNASDGDKPLALLYRRFTRQFDLAEKFFAGDNSRPLVVEHRLLYKTAAGNTWKMMEVLLKYQQQQQQQDGAGAVKTSYRTVHRAVQGETPPDLLRYIVETNAEDLTVPDEAGNLPLHYAARYRPPVSTDKKTHLPAFYSKYVMDELLYKYPEAAAQPDSAGLYPLTLAVQSGKQWIGGGIKSLYDAYPEALEQIHLTDHPKLRRALSMDYRNVIVDENDVEKEEKQAADIVRDEQHDAIMLVQQEEADISEVVTSMWAHEEDAGVQMLGCVAVSRLLKKQKKPGDCLRIALSAVPAVVNAMKAHPNEVIVQEKACHALFGMASADGHREVSFVASGAVAAVVGAMQAHVSDPNVQQEACGALGRILHCGGAERATVVASVSGVTAIGNALAAHPGVRGVQRNGCRALVELTEYASVANLPDLPRSQTESLLQSAKNNFAVDCAQAVDVLLSRLS